VSVTVCAIRQIPKYDVASLYSNFVLARLQELLERWRRSSETDPAQSAIRHYSVTRTHDTRIAALILLLSERRVVCCVWDRYALGNVGHIIKIVIPFTIKAIMFVALLLWIEPDFEYQPGRAAFTDTFLVCNRTARQMLK